MNVSALLDSIVPAELSQRLQRGTVITIGNFDGVHRGHQKIAATVREAAQKRGALAVALTFEPHPTTFFQKRPPESFRITTADTRTRRLKQAGMDEVVTIEFEQHFADLAARDFVFELLGKRLHAREIHIGYDFAFGRGREGTTSKLKELAEEAGIALVIHEAYQEGEAPISSTRVREALQAPDLEAAAELLGRPYSVDGVQASGAQRGRAMGIPTINLYPQGLALPPHGVYVSRTLAEGASWASITNVGIRPTFADDDRVSVETFILDEGFQDITPGAAIEVQLLQWIREERRFDSPEALRAQIGDDVKVANEFHARAKA